MPRQRSTSDSTVGFDLGAVVLDLNFDVHVQWCHLASLEKAVTDLRGKALVKDGSSLVAMFNFDVDTEGYFSPAVVGKRRYGCGAGALPTSPCISPRRAGCRVLPAGLLCVLVLKLRNERWHASKRCKRNKLQSWRASGLVLWRCRIAWLVCVGGLCRYRCDHATAALLSWRCWQG